MGYILRSRKKVAQGERQTTVERCTGIADSVDPTSVVLSRLGIGVSGSDCINQESARRFVVACEWTKEQRRGKERLLNILHCSTTLDVFPKLKERERKEKYTKWTQSCQIMIYHYSTNHFSIRTHQLIVFRNGVDGNVSSWHYGHCFP